MKKKKDRMIGYKILRGILGPIYKFYYTPKFIGLENVPEDGPIIFAGNHIHLMDQNAIIVCYKRPIHYMAKKEYWDSWKTRWFFNMAGCIPVNRSIKDKNATEKALEVLNNGHCIGLFPEGTRNKTDAFLLPFKFGAVSMAKKTKAMIVPFAVTGDYKFRSKNLVYRFGKPIKYGDDLAKQNEKLTKAITDLKNKSLKEEKNKEKGTKK